MASFDGFFCSIPTGMYPFDDLYRANDILNALKAFPDNDFEVKDDILLTPFYTHDAMRYELYVYELNIRLVRSILSFEDVLLAKTHKKNVDEVPERMKVVLNHCFFQIPEGKGRVGKGVLEDYLEYVMNNADISAEIEGVFPSESFNSGNLYFALY